MNTINGTYKNGQIVLDGPADWPDGCRLRIQPECVETPMGDSSETPEQIEDWLRWYHALEPLEFTPKEEAELVAWRNKKKEHGIARSQKRQEEMFS